MNRHTRALVFLACLAASAPAAAAWKFTRWGMTAPEIVKASGGKATTAIAGLDIACAFNWQKPIAVMPQAEIAGRRFDVAFCSRDGRTLEAVVLRGGRPAELRRDLLAQYGAPISQERLVTTWQDAKAGNTVSLIDLAGISAVIEYKARSSGL